MKTYKGFNKDMTCIGFQYEEGKEYETNEAVCCQSGFHACEMPLDVFKYYAPSQSVYHEVEQYGDISRDNEDTKISSTNIKIGAKIGVAGIVKAQINFIFDKIKKSREKAESEEDIESAATSGFKSSAATSGNWSSAATSGDWSCAATSGFRSSAATSGNGSCAATSGNESCAATSGFRSSAATSGDWSSAATSGFKSCAATSGNWSCAATSGFKSCAATSGNGSCAATSGNESCAATSNKNAIVLACGKKAKAKGVKGSYLVLTEWNEDSTELLCAKMERVDGEKIKENIWYVLQNGEFVEVKED